LFSRIFLASLMQVVFFAAASAQNDDSIIIDHVNVIPMTSETVMRDQRVLIAGGKIVRIEDASSPEGIKVSHRINGNGKFLIPGLSEMHFHFRSNDIASDLKLLVANGITTVRNMSSPPNKQHIEIGNKTKSGELLPVNYVTSGPYLTSRDLLTTGHVEKVVKMHVDSGYDFLKLADNLAPDIYLSVLNECEKNHLPVVGHSQRNQPMEFSLRMKSIEHVEEFLYLSDSIGGATYFKRNEADLKQAVRQIKASGVYVGTTLSVFEFINNCMTDSAFESLRRHAHQKYLARDQRDAFLSEKNDYRKMRKATFDGVPAPRLFNDYFIWMKSFTRQLNEAGVALLTGSDTYGMVIVGFSLHEEFRLLQESGVRPFDILLASTVTPARLLNRYASEGTVTEGKNANLVLLSKNPLDNIENTKTIEGVILKGRWIERKEIDKMLREVQRAFE
jgi:hypothetical protein